MKTEGIPERVSNLFENMELWWNVACSETFIVTLDDIWVLMYVCV